MLQYGIVRKLNKNTVDVEIHRSSACGESCASCGLCPGTETITAAENTLNAVVGDRVIIDMSDKKVLGAAFLVYIIPIIMLIIGYAVGSAVFHKESIAIVSGFLLMVLTFAVIILIDKKIKHCYTPRIVKIL